MRTEMIANFKSCENVSRKDPKTHYNFIHILNLFLASFWRFNMAPENYQKLLPWLKAVGNGAEN